MTIAKVAATPAAIAKKPMPGRPGAGCIPPHEIIALRAFAKLDANDDMKISRDEFVRSATLAGRVQEAMAFRRYDADGDGAVSRQEYLAGRNPMLRRVER